jgi:phosphatidylserine decarboxylase
MFRLLTSPRLTDAIGFLVYDACPSCDKRRVRRAAKKMGVNLSECLEPEEALASMRRLFQRKIRYWIYRPMDPDPRTVVSPADARVIVGNMPAAFGLPIKEKFFNAEELIGDRRSWNAAFLGGEYALFRLTPDKYHYNHVPVSGMVLDRYAVDGCCCSCNPGAVVKLVTPHSRNRRVVTIIDTDVADGSGVGLVAMVEVVAMMIGRVEQCYSEERYDHPVDVRPGMFLKRGRPKSLYYPGSSTDVLLFQKGRVRFCDDLIQNRDRTDVASRYSVGFGRPLVETDVRVRSLIARAISFPNVVSPADDQNNIEKNGVEK